MLSTKKIGKFYAGVKKFGRFTNEKYFFSSSQNALAFLLRRKIFRKKMLITLTTDVSLY